MNKLYFTRVMEKIQVFLHPGERERERGERDRGLRERGGNRELLDTYVTRTAKGHVRTKHSHSDSTAGREHAHTISTLNTED